jgi:hypothetical protein
MGMISDWMTGSLRHPEPSLERTVPLSLEDALEATDLTLHEAHGQWVLSLNGFPREWLETQEEARRRAQEWSHMEPTIEHVSGPTWMLFAGDQYVFTATSREEAESFVFGVAVGQFFEKTDVEHRRRQSGTP